jgi:hypothetical protein
VEFLDRNYNDSLKKMFAQPTVKLREELLLLNGVGPETADSILLYAGQHPFSLLMRTPAELQFGMDSRPRTRNTTI